MGQLYEAYVRGKVPQDPTNLNAELIEIEKTTPIIRQNSSFKSLY